MSRRDRIDPVRVAAYFWAALFVGAIAWIFIQEYLVLDITG